MSSTSIQSIVHADWSVQPGKRWRCEAKLVRMQGKSRWRVEPPEPVGDVRAWVSELIARIERGERLALGLDLPIGLPAAYAKRCGVRDFRDLLPRLGRGEWDTFFDVAEQAAEISLRRPFYPNRGRSGVRQSHLVRGLGLETSADLLRRCDHATAQRNAAGSLFWTVGAKQVGKAAISGWREVVTPLLDALGDRAGLWPFDGEWGHLQRHHSLVIAETYPAEFYARFGFPRSGWSKRKPDDRRQRFHEAVQWTRSQPITLGLALRYRADAGFGRGGDGEDAFDSAIGTLGMVACVTGSLGHEEPRDPTARRVEGWILGRGGE
ncbi:MAG: DUF429 domain-containing protein [Phycisphaeraceae bacterium]